MGASCRSRNGRVPWSKLDKVLLVLTITALALSAIACVTIMRRAIIKNCLYDMNDDYLGRRHHHHHQPSSAARTQFDETDCEVDGFEDDQDEMECSQNERGEWCAAQAPPMPQRTMRERRDDHSRERGPHTRRGMHHGDMGSSQEGDHERRMRGRGMQPADRGSESGEHHERRMMPSREEESEQLVEPELPEIGVRWRPHDRRIFPCMRMRVLMRLGQMTRTGTAHLNLTAALNFPGCSFSSCEENRETNRHRMEEARRHWEAQRHQPTRCLVNRENPGQVIILSPHVNLSNFFKSYGFQLTFWTFVLGMVTGITLIVRRCRSKKTETKKVAPEKLPGGAYLVTSVPTEGMSEKEKEALGLSPPQVVTTSCPNAPSKEFLVLAPPAYDSDLTVKPIGLLSTPPPPYLAERNAMEK